MATPHWRCKGACTAQQIECEVTLQGTPERLAPGSGEDEGHAPWVWVGAEAVVIRSILRALHGHCITELPRGWTALERTACHLRHG